jgi:hypothetical protein
MHHLSLPSLRLMLFSFLITICRTRALTPLSRFEFVSTLLSPTSLLLPWTKELEELVRLPLRFLPIGGCWALKVTLTDRDYIDLKYFGILDTGSPFLTSPTVALERSYPTKYPTTKEQYGESTGGVQWRRADYVTLLVAGKDGQTMVERTNVVLGVASEQVLRETGGIFVGLIERDDNRPTFLQQYGYRSFGIQFRPTTTTATTTTTTLDPSIVFSKGSIIAKQDPDSFELFDLKSYGPNLHHYGIVCRNDLAVTWTTEDTANGESHTERIPISSLTRPVIAILDTGLTGCIFSDSLQQELGVPSGDFSSMQGLAVSLTTLGGTSLELKSRDQYWRFSSFRLPWFYDESSHPHIIALGSTFWANTDSLVIDTISRRAKIIVPPNVISTSE